MTLFQTNKQETALQEQESDFIARHQPSLNYCSKVQFFALTFKMNSHTYIFLHFNDSVDTDLDR